MNYESFGYQNRKNCHPFFSNTFWGDLTCPNIGLDNRTMWCPFIIFHSSFRWFDTPGSWVQNGGNTAYFCPSTFWGFDLSNGGSKQPKFVQALLRWSWLMTIFWSKKGNAAGFWTRAFGDNSTYRSLGFQKTGEHTAHLCPRDFWRSLHLYYRTLGFKRGSAACMCLATLSDTFACELFWSEARRMLFVFLRYVKLFGTMQEECCPLLTNRFPQALLEVIWLMFFDICTGRSAAHFSYNIFGVILTYERLCFFQSTENDSDHLCRLACSDDFELWKIWDQNRKICCPFLPDKFRSDLTFDSKSQAEMLPAFVQELLKVIGHANFICQGCTNGGCAAHFFKELLGRIGCFINLVYKFGFKLEALSILPQLFWGALGCLNLWGSVLIETMPCGWADVWEKMKFQCLVSFYLGVHPLGWVAKPRGNLH